MSQFIEKIGGSERVKQLLIQAIIQRRNELVAQYFAALVIAQQFNKASNPHFTASPPDTYILTKIINDKINKNCELQSNGLPTIEEAERNPNLIDKYFFFRVSFELGLYEDEILQELIDQIDESQRLKIIEHLKKDPFIVGQVNLDSKTVEDSNISAEEQYLLYVAHQILLEMDKPPSTNHYQFPEVA